MSQHFYKTTYKNRPVEVIMGWDRPTQEYSLWSEYSDLHAQKNHEEVMAKLKEIARFLTVDPPSVVKLEYVVNGS